MDYEQKYNEALEMAREAFYSTETPHVAKAWLLTMFPTIAESKDEQIRKEFCKDIRTFIPNEKANKYIAWLEKQGHMLAPDKVIEWLEEHVPTKFEDMENYVQQFKYDFGL